MRALALSLLLISSPAFAQTVFNSQDWGLDDSNPGERTKGNCTAYTAAYFNGAQVFSLQLSLDKSGARPLEILLRPENGNSAERAFQLELADGSYYVWGRMPKQNGKDLFWQIPRGTAEFISLVKRYNQMNVQTPAGLEIPFSLYGGKDVLTEMEKRCTAKQPLVAEEFERLFIPARAKQVPASSMSPEKTNALRATVGRGVEAYQGILKIRAELASLEARYAALTREQSELRAALDQLVNRELPALIRARDEAQANVDKAEADIVSLRAAIAADETRLAAAMADYDVAMRNLAPHVAEHDRLAAIVWSDTQRRDQAASRLSSIQQGIRNTEYALQSSYRESEDLTRRLGRLREEVRIARIQHADAESALRNFEMTAIPAAQQNVRQAEQRYQFAAREVEQRQRALEQCQRGAPGADCAAERNELAQAQNRLSQAQMELNRAQNELQQRMYERDNLSRREADARRRVSELQLEENRTYNRISYLNQQEIPRLQNELYIYQSQLPGAERELADAQDTLARSTAAYEAFKRTVNYDYLVSEVNRTNAKVQEIRGRIAGYQQQIVLRQQRIREQTALRDSLIQRIAATNESIRQKRERLEVVTAALVPYEAEKAEVVGRLNGANALLAAISREFEGQLP